MNNLKRFLLIVVFFLLMFFSYSIAYADAGTPLIFRVLWHAWVGNIIIGVIEGILIAKIFRLRLKPAISIMIGANYSSMIIGYFAIKLLKNSIAFHSFFGKIPFYHVNYLLLFFIILSYLLTIIIEWPFCLLAFGESKERRKGKKSLIASIVAQSVSYAILVPYYLSASGIVHNNVSFERNPAFVSSKNAIIYFISTKDSGVYRIKPDGSPKEKVVAVNIANPNARLFVSKPAGAKTWDLWVWGYPKNGKETLLLKSFATRATPSRFYENRRREEGTNLNFGPALDLNPENQQNWSVTTTYESSLFAKNKRGQGLYVSFEAPLLGWTIRNATILPDDQVVFQLYDQIILLDLNARKMALVTFGRGPIVVLDDAPSEQYLHQEMK